jgi:thioesterase domain-containing protein
LVSQNGGVLDVSASELMALEPDERLNHVLDKVKTAGVAPSDTSQDVALSWMRRLLKGFRIRLQAFRAYEPEVYHGEITLFRGDINPGHLQDGAMGDVLNLFKDPTHGWSGLSDRPIKVEPVPGYHETLLSEPHVQTVASRLRDCIEQTEEVVEA